MKVITSPFLLECPGVLHGFGTAAEPISTELQAHWDLKKPNWKQVHGCGVAQAEGIQSQNLGEVDAIWSGAQAQPIAVVTADCVPILLARRDGTKVAAVHAGWRGTRARILRALWQELMNSGENPRDWVAAIGPAIGPCCYEVSNELATDFKKEFQSFGNQLAVPRERVLDLPAINHAELLDLGLHQIDLIRACTKCFQMGDEFSFMSYRRLGSGSRQYSMIMIS